MAFIATRRALLSSHPTQSVYPIISISLTPNNTVKPLNSFGWTASMISGGPSNTVYNLLDSANGQFSIGGNMLRLEKPCGNVGTNYNIAIQASAPGYTTTTGYFTLTVTNNYTNGLIERINPLNTSLMWQDYAATVPVSANGNEVNVIQGSIAGWTATNSRAALKSCTISIGSPGVVTANGHNIPKDTAIVFSVGSGGSLPTGVTAGTTYYTIASGLTGNQFRFAVSKFGAAVNTSGSTSGPIYVRYLVAGPTYLTNVQNGRPALSFDGTDQFLTFVTDAATQYIGSNWLNDPFTVVAVIQSTEPSFTSSTNIRNFIGWGSTAQIGKSSWTQVSSGANFSVGVKADGTLWSWGTNTYGQLGTNDVAGRTSPVQIGSGSWTQVATGANFTIAIKTDGTVWSWGNNAGGQLGDGTVVNRSSPVQISAGSWTMVESGSSSSVAIKADGTLWSWGNNANGQLGDGTVISKSSPVQIGTSSWTQISSGGNFSLGIGADGTLWSWGNNANGQLGDGTTVDKSSPVQIGTSSWTQISSGYSTSMAIRTDGGLFSWGNNANGQLGDATIISKSSPVQIGTSSWTQISTGNNFTVAISSTGFLWAWGSNSNGQYGDGTTTTRSSPVQVGSAAWSKVNAGNSFTNNIQYDGTLWSWGTTLPTTQWLSLTARPEMNITVTSTSALDNTVFSQINFNAINLPVGSTVVPGSTIGNMISGTTYYVTSIVSANADGTYFTVSTSLGGPTFTQINKTITTSAVNFKIYNNSYCMGAFVVNSAGSQSSSARITAGNPGIMSYSNLDTPAVPTNVTLQVNGISGCDKGAGQVFNPITNTASTPINANNANIGVNGSGSGIKWKGYVLDLLFYNRSIGTVEMEYIHQELAAEWGISLDKTITITGMSSSTNIITTSSNFTTLNIFNINNDSSFVLGSDIGNLKAGKVYYVYNIINPGNNSTFMVSEFKTGPALNPGDYTGSASATVSVFPKGPYLDKTGWPMWFEDDFNGNAVGWTPIQGLYGSTPLGSDGNPTGWSPGYINDKTYYGSSGAAGAGSGELEWMVDPRNSAFAAAGAGNVFTVANSTMTLQTQPIPPDLCSVTPPDMSSNGTLTVTNTSAIDNYVTVTESLNWTKTTTGMPFVPSATIGNLISGNTYWILNIISGGPTSANTPISVSITNTYATLDGVDNLIKTSFTFNTVGYFVGQSGMRFTVNTAVGGLLTGTTYYIKTIISDGTNSTFVASATPGGDAVVLSDASPSTPYPVASFPTVFTVSESRYGPLKTLTSASGSVSSRQPRPYLSGVLNSQGWKARQFGIIEIRMKMSKYQPGLWPALWMMPNHGSYWNTEIDIFENFSVQGQTTMFSTLHTMPYANSNNNGLVIDPLSNNIGLGIRAPIDLEDSDFHTYSTKWDEDGLEFFFDGRSIGRTPNYNGIRKINIVNPGSGLTNGTYNLYTPGAYSQVRYSGGTYTTGSVTGLGARISLTVTGGTVTSYSIISSGANFNREPVWYTNSGYTIPLSTTLPGVEITAVYSDDPPLPLPYHEPFYLLLNLALGSQSGVLDPLQPAPYMQLDYVRWYKKQYPTPPEIVPGYDPAFDDQVNAAVNAIEAYWNALGASMLTYVKDALNVFVRTLMAYQVRFDRTPPSEQISQWDTSKLSLWDACDLLYVPAMAQNIADTGPSACTFTIGTPTIVNATNHGLVSGNPIVFSISAGGVMPTGLTAGIVYYVISTGLTADQFEVSSTLNGSAIATSGSTSGTVTFTTFIALTVALINIKSPGTNNLTTVGNGITYNFTTGVSLPGVKGVYLESNQSPVQYTNKDCHFSMFLPSALVNTAEAAICGYDSSTTYWNASSTTFTAKTGTGTAAGGFSSTTRTMVGHEVLTRGFGYLSQGRGTVTFYQNGEMQWGGSVVGSAAISGTYKIGATTSSTAGAQFSFLSASSGRRLMQAECEIYNTALRTLFASLGINITV